MTDFHIADRFAVIYVPAKIAAVIILGGSTTRPTSHSLMSPNPELRDSSACF